MCIPCTMCGACLERMGDLPPNVCPSCGSEVPDDALVCPSCYTLVPRRREQPQTAEKEPARGV